MTENALFSSGTGLASFVTSSGLLHRSWDVIKSRHKEGIVSSSWKQLSWNVYKEPNSTLTIIAFEYPSTEGAPPHASFNNTAISLLENNSELRKFVSEVSISTQLIVTGHGFGGFFASLFTSLLDSIWSKKNSVLCITFGSPLIANKKLQQDLSNSNFSFLHVVSLRDSLPWLYHAFTLSTSAYMPSGIFLFCSDLSSACFENPESVLEFLKKLSPINIQDQEFQYDEYGKIVENLYRKGIYKDLTTLPENMTHPESNSVLASSISLQLRALHLQQQDVDINTLEKNMKELDQKFYYEKREKFSSSTELNEMKIRMAELELYKKKMKTEKIGYYDGYKNNLMDSCNNHDDLESPTIIEIHKMLTNYWKKMVEEVKIKPQKEGGAFRTRWLYAGTNYRRMVEPLAIAEYYRKGSTDYITNRHEHFVLLEKWLSDETLKGQTSKDLGVNVNKKQGWKGIVTEYIESSRGSQIDEEESIWALGVNVNKKQDWEGIVTEYIESSQGSQIDEEESIWDNKLNSYRISDDEICVNVSNMVDNNLSSTRNRNVELILTFDSCFWAHVEEAFISLKDLKDLQLVKKIRSSQPLFHLVIREEEKKTLQRLIEFEEYVYALLKKYEVSSEIFLPESSYMLWWKEYKAIKGTSYASNLASFMNDQGNYEQYALGEHGFI